VPAADLCWQVADAAQLNRQDEQCAGSMLGDGSEDLLRRESRREDHRSAQGQAGRQVGQSVPVMRRRRDHDRITGPHRDQPQVCGDRAEQDPPR
jgi:hypothetical protein